MRKLLIGGLAVAAALAVAAVAYAATQQTYEQSYTTRAKNRSAGTSILLTVIDPENTENNQQPDPARQVTVTLPRGSRVDSGAAPQCRELDESATPPCPNRTKVGEGEAEVRLRFPVSGRETIPATVTAYNRRNGLWLYVVPQLQGQAPVVLRPTWDGLRLVTNLDPLCVPPGTPPDCDPRLGEAAISRFELRTTPKSRGRGARRRNLLTTPRTCPRGGWRFRLNVRYATQAPVTRTDTSPCRR